MAPLASGSAVVYECVVKAVPLRGLFVESMAGGPEPPRSPEAALINRATPSSTALHRLSVLIQPDGHSQTQQGMLSPVIMLIFSVQWN